MITTYVDKRPRPDQTRVCLTCISPLRPTPAQFVRGQAPGRLRPPVRWAHCSLESSTASVGCIRGGPTEADGCNHQGKGERPNRTACSFACFACLCCWVTGPVGLLCRGASGCLSTYMPPLSLAARGCGNSMMHTHTHPHTHTHTHTHTYIHTHNKHARTHVHVHVHAHAHAHIVRANTSHTPYTNLGDRLRQYGATTYAKFDG